MEVRWRPFSPAAAWWSAPDPAAAGTNLLVRLAPCLGDDASVEGVVVAFIDISTLIRAERRQQVLVDDLLHRTRDLLAMVRNIARQTFGRGGSVEAVSERLSAPGRVQGLVTAPPPTR